MRAVECKVRRKSFPSEFSDGRYPDLTASTFGATPPITSLSAEGEHVCVGMNLARIEMRALLEALVPRVERFERARA